MSVTKINRNKVYFFQNFSLVVQISYVDKTQNNIRTSSVTILEFCLVLLFENFTKNDKNGQKFTDLVFLVQPNTDHNRCTVIQI